VCLSTVLIFHDEGAFLAISIWVIPEQFAPAVALGVHAELQLANILACTHLVGILAHDCFGVFCAGFDDELKFDGLGKAVVDDEGRQQLVETVLGELHVLVPQDCELVLFLLDQHLQIVYFFHRHLPSIGITAQRNPKRVNVVERDEIANLETSGNFGCIPIPYDEDVLEQFVLHHCV
jgi:hypothetical protein